MNQIAPIHERVIRSIALDRLYIAPENVRKTPPDAIAEAEIEASTATHGLLENLVARSEGPDGYYAVVAGGRRLAALKALAGTTSTLTNETLSTRLPRRDSPHLDSECK